MVDEETGAVFDHPDDLLAFLGRYGRTTQASPDERVMAQIRCPHIAGTVNHDLAVISPVVDPLFEPVKIQGDPMSAEICIARDEKSEAAFIRFRAVGKRLGIFPAAVASMSHKSLEQQVLRSQVNDIKALFL